MDEEKINRFASVLLCIAWISFPVYATEESPLEVSANAIRVGCLVSFAKQFHPVQDDPLSAICWQHGNVTMVRSR